MSKIKTLNAALLIVGTSIGAGMLGLPVETGGGGFVPALIFLIINWVVMTGTALLLVELLNEFHHKANFISLADRIFGPTVRTITFIVYILLFVSLTFAYVKGGGVFLSDFSEKISITSGSIFFLLLFVPLIILGSKVLGYGNTVLTFTLMASFILLVGLGLSVVNSDLLRHVNWKLGLFSFPIYITSFGFHSVLPSLSAYVKNKIHLRTAVIIGTTITFSIYVVWQLVVMGIVPLAGENGLLATLQADQTAITPLKYHLRSPLLVHLAQIFYFTALTTSFLGVGLGLIDFLLDTFKIKQKWSNRLYFSLLIYVPALWIAQSNLRIFYLSLKYGGGSACFYLLILLPIMLFFKHRHARKT